MAPNGGRRRQHSAVLALVVLALLMAAILGWLGYRAASRSLGQAVGGSVASFVVDSGALAADSAATVALNQKLSYESLTLTTLNESQPNYHWVANTIPVTVSTGSRTMVGVDASGNHVITVSQPVAGMCSFGLVVSSPSDPIIRMDELYGPGIYGMESTADFGGCRALDAPHVGWVAISKASLNTLRQRLKN